MVKIQLRELLKGLDVPNPEYWMAQPPEMLLALGQAKRITQSFSEVHPRNPDAKCKCEHWQACIECHPTYMNAAPKGLK
jgi:hypothetical protein